MSELAEDSAEEIAEAEKQGWQDDFEGDNKKSAKEFLHDGTFFKKIDDQNKEIKELKNSMSQLSGHYDKVVANELRKAEVDYNTRIEQLKTEKVEALDEGDNRRVVEIDDQILRTEKPKPVEKQSNPEFDAWVKDNDWYNNKPFLKVEADKLGDLYYNSGLRGTELYNAIGGHIQELFPDKFVNTKRSKAPSVEGGSGNGPAPTGSKLSVKDLTQDELGVFKNFKRMDIFKNKDDEQKYLREVIEVR